MWLNLLVYSLSRLGSRCRLWCRSRRRGWCRRRSHIRLLFFICQIQYRQDRIVATLIKRQLSVPLLNDLITDDDRRKRCLTDRIRICFTLCNDNIGIGFRLRIGLGHRRIGIGKLDLSLVLDLLGLVVDLCGLLLRDGFVIGSIEIRITNGQLDDGDRILSLG